MILNKFSVVTHRQIIDGGLHQFIDSIQMDLNALGGAIHDTYFARSERTPLQQQSQS